MIIHYLEGQSLFGYVTDDIPCPPKFIASLDATTFITTQLLSPKYSMWYQQDKLILSTLLFTLIESLLIYVVGIKTRREVWLALERMFAAQSHAYVMQLRYQLAILTKGASSISDYFQKAQTIAHELEAIDEPIKDSELASYVLAGLGSNYDPLITSITTHLDPVSLEDLYGHLLTHERLEHATTAGDLDVSNVHGSHRSNSNLCRNQGHFHFGRGRGRGGCTRGSSYLTSFN